MTVMEMKYFLKLELNKSWAGQIVFLLAP